jgi:DNA-binding NarL/FixJ family response regulator
MAGQVIRVAIVDDHPVVRDGTAALLAAQPDIQITWTAGSLEESERYLSAGAVDVLLLDIRLGGESGLRLLGAPGADAGSNRDPDPRWRAHRPPAVVVLSAYDYPQYVEAADRLGAVGFVVKTAPISTLVAAIRTASAGGRAFEVAPGPADRLSPRELDVVRLLVRGRSNDEIGVELGIGTKTVETHLHRLFERCRVASRTELVSRAIQNGWLELP